MLIRLRKTKNMTLIKKINHDIMPEDVLETDEKTTAWICYVDGQVAGFCTMRTLDNGIAYLDRGGVYSRFQGLGIHRKLISVRERHARHLGLTRVITYVLTTNYQSMFTLVRCDYKRYQPSYAWVGRDVMYFIKEFDQET